MKIPPFNKKHEGFRDIKANNQSQNINSIRKVPELVARLHKSPSTSQINNLKSYIFYQNKQKKD